MNKIQKEFLEICKKVKYDDELPLFDSIVILPTQKRHDSGYKIMYVVGEVFKTQEKYLLDTYCDVTELGDFGTLINGLSLDIPENGIIRLWSRNGQRFKSCFRVSSCTFEVIEKE